MGLGFALEKSELIPCAAGGPSQNLDDKNMLPTLLIHDNNETEIWQSK
jgi:hypothetical protein